MKIQTFKEKTILVKPEICRELINCLVGYAIANQNQNVTSMPTSIAVWRSKSYNAAVRTHNLIVDEHRKNLDAFTAIQDAFKSSARTETIQGVEGTEPIVKEMKDAKGFWVIDDEQKAKEYKDLVDAHDYEGKQKSIGEKEFELEVYPIRLDKIESIATSSSYLSSDGKMCMPDYSIIYDLICF